MFDSAYILHSCQEQIAGVELVNMGLLVNDN